MIILLLTGCHLLEKENSRFVPSSYEFQTIRHRSSNLKISMEEMEKWDQTVAQLVHDSAFSLSETARLYCYLYCGQKAFADAAFRLTTAYSGSIDLISYEIIKLFAPQFEKSDLEFDSFSKELTAALMRQIKSRFQREQKGIRPVKMAVTKNTWDHSLPVEMNAPSMKPWAMKRADEFQTDPPPDPNSPAWDDQLDQVREGLQNASDFQKERSHFWSKMHTPQESDWKYIANTYMKERHVPFETFVAVRAKLAMAIMDGFIAVFYDKYKYMVKRPDMRDKSLQTLFPNPQHPSYPSGHSTISSAAATVLLYYFPENSTRWNFLAEEAGASRLWAGIHFPIDMEAGKKQGKQVGKAVLFRD